MEHLRLEYTSERGLVELEKQNLLGLLGPTRVQNHGAKSYFLTIIDNYSRKV